MLICLKHSITGGYDKQKLTHDTCQYLPKISKECSMKSTSFLKNSPDSQTGAIGVLEKLMFLSILLSFFFFSQCFADNYFDDVEVWLNVKAKIDCTDYLFADMDGDGDKDLITADNPNNSGISWLENDNGILKDDKNTTLAFTANVKSLNITDCDADGDNDIVYLNGYGYLCKSVNDGSGYFTHETISFDPLFTLGNQIACEDFDQDGINDIIVFSDVIKMFRKNSLADSFCVYTLTDSVEEFRILEYINKTYDIDNDGDKDIFAVSETNDLFGWLEFDSDSISFVNFHPIANIADNITNYKYFDVNNDGFVDVLYSDETNELKVRYNDSSHSFSNENILYSGPDGIEDFSLADIDNDGLNELFIRYETGITIAYSNTNYVYTPIPNFPTVGTILSILDWDNDGFIDLLTYSGTNSCNRIRGSSVMMFYNNNGSFDSCLTEILDFRSAFILSYEEEFDGRYLYAANLQSIVKVNNQSTEDDHFVNIIGTSFILDCDFADIDDNQITDFAVIECDTNKASTEGERLRVYMNSSNSIGFTLIDTSGFSGCRFIDIDCDDDNDLVVDYANSNKRVYINDSGSFSASGFIEFPFDEKYFYCLSDINNDSYPDAIYSVSTENGVDLMYSSNNSGLSFSELLHH